MHNNIAVGNRLRLARLYSNYSSKELAAQLDCSTAALSLYEGGKRSVRDPDLIKKICDTTGVNAQWLTTGHGLPCQDMTSFADKTGAYIADNHKVFNPDIFIQLYSQVKTLLNGKNLDDAVQLTVTAYQYVLENAESSEQQERLIAGAAKLAVTVFVSQKS